MILHGNRMEVDYIQEFLNQNPTLLIDGNFEHIVGWKVCDYKCNLVISGLILFSICKKMPFISIFCRSQQSPPLKKRRGESTC